MTAFYLKQYLPDLAPIVVYLLTTIAGFAGAIALNEVISRIQILRWCVLGTKREVKT